MKDVNTDYGTFKAGDIPGIQAMHNDKSQAIGANIFLAFTPNDKVTDAEQFGFVQAVKSKEHGHAVSPDGTKGNRVRRPGKSHGYAIDQDFGFRNPLYATTSKTTPEQQDKLEGYEANGMHTPTDDDSDDCLITDRKWAGYGTFGQKKEGDPNPTDATFQDAPHSQTAIKNASQHFETTVLITKGKQAGTYLGSIKWGYKLGGGDKITIEEPELVSSGAPSKIFFDAAKKWNKTSTEVGEETKKHIALPVPQPAPKPVTK